MVPRWVVYGAQGVAVVELRHVWWALVGGWVVLCSGHWLGTMSTVGQLWGCRGCAFLSCSCVPCFPVGLLFSQATPPVSLRKNWAVGTSVLTWVRVSRLMARLGCERRVVCVGAVGADDGLVHWHHATSGWSPSVTLPSPSGFI